MEIGVELTADEAASISNNVCDTVDASLADIYTKILEQAKMGRQDLIYMSAMTTSTWFGVRKALEDKRYSIYVLSDYMIRIHFEELPF